MSDAGTLPRIVSGRAPSTQPGLRERNYRETHQRIHFAALEIVEQDGLGRTTTARIAAAAGVSRRTFFRYFSCKEDAVLPGHRRFLDVVETFELPAATPPSPRNIFGVIEAVCDYVLELEEAPELDVHRRVSALLVSEPELRTYGAAQDVAIAERLAERLAAIFPKTASSELALLSDLGITAWRHGWIRWSTQPAGAHMETPAQSHHAVRVTVRAACSGELR